ncbi:MAG: signal peptidase II [Candidatus Aminicenantes bacterium]|nr:signal peptidase II [Candidatus Aminicenantes bacterium]
MNRRIFYLLFILVLLAADQLTKAIVAQKIPFLNSKSIIPGFFNLTHIRNRGAIFGFFSQSGSQFLYVVLTLASLAALALVILYFFKTPTSERLMIISLSLILAGALGNMIDRIFRGYVIDFMDFYVKKWHWPSFNIADASITIGAVIIIFLFFFRKGLKCSLSS